MAKRATVEDIAKYCGVSSATVSRVVNHRELVKPQTVKLVEDAMQALGVTPRHRDNFIESYQKNIIVLVVEHTNHSYYYDILQGALDGASEHDCDFIATQFSPRKGSIHDFIRFLKNVHASGVITLSAFPAESLDAVSRVVPVVQCCEYNPQAKQPYVIVDNYESAKLATEYLITSGRRKIAFLNGPLSYQMAADRRRGYTDALKEAGMEIKPEYYIQLIGTSFDLASITIAKKLDSGFMPDAIFAASDIFAAAAIKEAMKRGCQIPKDIAVVGFSNSLISMMTSPTITTVSQPSYKLGRCACDMLHNIITNPDLKIDNHILKTEFVIRESTRLKLSKNNLR